MEADPAFAQAVMDAINGFNELEWQAMRAAIVADMRLHCILPLYDMLYTDKEGELWYFDDTSHTHSGLEGVFDKAASWGFLSFALRWCRFTSPADNDWARMECWWRTPTNVTFMARR